MAAVLFLALLATPFAEIALLVYVGGAIGLWPTLLVVAATAAIGAALLRYQGLKTWLSARAAAARGDMPLRQVFDGICLLLAGAFLLTPGFITDGFGALLLAPPVRAGLRRWFGRRMVILEAAGSPNGQGIGGPASAGWNRPRDDAVIDAEYQVVEEPPDDDGNGGSGRPGDSS